MADVKTEPADIEEIATIIEEHDVKKGESSISKLGHLELGPSGTITGSNFYEHILAERTYFIQGSFRICRRNRDSRSSRGSGSIESTEFRLNTRRK